MNRNTRHLLIAFFVTFAALALVLAFPLTPGWGRGVHAAPSRPANTPPTANFSVDPPQGVVGTLFFFDPDLSSDAEDSNAWLESRFDFDGDGTWDTAWGNPTNPAVTYIYSAAGTYQAKLEIRDTGGLTDTAVVTVQVGDPGGNTAPTARCTGSPATGSMDTVFTFSASGSTDAQDATSALKVKWDKWGTFDFRGQSWQPATQPVTFTYSTQGIHSVDLIVMDSGYLISNTSCEVNVLPPGGNNPPTAKLSVTPSYGTYTTTFTADMSGSTDDWDSLANLSVRFDWNGDGTYDTGWLNASQLWQNTFTYDWGPITVRAQVQDSGGLTDEATQSIYVKAPYEVYLPLSIR